MPRSINWKFIPFFNDPDTYINLNSKPVQHTYSRGESNQHICPDTDDYGHPRLHRDVDPHPGTVLYDDVNEHTKPDSEQIAHIH